MSHAMRFLGLAVATWVGVRAVSLGMFPGMTALVPPASAATPPMGDPLPPIAQTDLMPPAMPSADVPPDPARIWSHRPYPVMAQAPLPPAYIVVPAQSQAPRMVRTAVPSRVSAWDRLDPAPVPADYAQLGTERWTQPPASFEQSPAHARTRTVPGSSAPVVPKLDRWQLSAWALLREQPGQSSLATGGMLGGSQAGARLAYRFTPKLAASLRFSSAVGGVRGAEVAAGVRWQPLRSVPVAINLERREALGKFGGRSAFAAFAEGGVYQRPIVEKFSLDAYAQAGIVGVGRTDWFADGSLALTRPIWNRLSGGFGVWAGGQTGIYRIDAGPRLSFDVGRGLRMHVDYRQRIAGHALPASGPALTIAGDF